MGGATARRAGGGRACTRRRSRTNPRSSGRLEQIHKIIIKRVVRGPRTTERVAPNRSTGTEKRNPGPLTPPRRSDRGATPSAAVPSGRRSGRRASTRFPASRGTGTGRRERVNERALADAPMSFARAARGRCARSRLVPSTCSAVRGQLAPAPRPGEPRTPAAGVRCGAR